VLSVVKELFCPGEYGRLLVVVERRQTQRERCEFRFDHGTADEAERTLRALIDHAPDDASAYHNLGTLLMRSGRHEEAMQVYRQSLRYRPNYAATYLNLGYAL
jgi:Flp pilus assembly protein TadD